MKAECCAADLTMFDINTKPLRDQLRRRSTFATSYSVKFRVERRQIKKCKKTIMVSSHDAPGPLGPGSKTIL